jgi:hypothetical protein
MRSVVLGLGLGLSGAVSCHSPPVVAPRANAPCPPPTHTRDLVVLDPEGQASDTSGKAVDVVGGIQRVLVCSQVIGARHGRVVEADGGRSLPNAVVIVESWLIPAPLRSQRPERRLFRSVEVRSDVEGAWSVGQEWAWMQGMLTGGGFPAVVESFCVRAPGYASFVFDPWQRADDAVGGPPPVVALKKSAAPDAPEPATGSVSKCGIAWGRASGALPR